MLKLDDKNGSAVIRKIDALRAEFSVKVACVEKVPDSFGGRVLRPVNSRSTIVFYDE